MAKSRDANRGAIIKRPRARLDHKSGGANADADAQLRAQVEFYSKLRDSLFANSDLTAAQAVDTVALAVLADVATFPAELGQVVVLLPPPESTTQRPLPRHDLFSPPVASLRPPKRPATRSSTDSKPSATKKRRGSKDQDEDSDKCRLELPDDCPREIRRDIHRLFKTAAEQGKLPYRIAYPWAVAAKLQKGAYEVPGEEKPFKPKEQGGDDSDFVDDEDTFAVLPPTAPVTGSYPFTSSEEEDEADELEDKRSAPPADEADGDQEDDDQGDLHEDDDEHSPGTGDQSRADQDDSPVPSMGSTTSKSAAKSK
ncbi:hypothetical protein PR002_g5446 [Phytophthora rubi]|uniref:Uncharacterized protein n=1 Tax=Phytophthora rubi TaxID=129364 RepID=A0A6A3NGS5_9STRA|nr:hypothetical protein PR002_g5446 [Phytophthora rubi]